MRLPEPIPGLVIRYGFLWSREARAGQEEGRKTRPCAIVLAVPSAGMEKRIYLLPITHCPPSDLGAALELPTAIKKQLRLDDGRSWIMLDEINDFLWPGFDLDIVPGLLPERVDYGVLPPRFFSSLQSAFAAFVRTGRVARTQRD